jgi:hypothetical protein
MGVKYYLRRSYLHYPPADGSLMIGVSTTRKEEFLYGSNSKIKLLYHIIKNKIKCKNSCEYLVVEIRN